MPESGEGKFFISEKLATIAYRGTHTGSGIGGSREHVRRETIKDHLGLNIIGSASPENTMAGILLMGYITSSTRLIGILEGQSPEVIREQVQEYLQLNPVETPQQTFERLLDIAMANSQRINSL